MYLLLAERERIVVGEENLNVEGKDDDFYLRMVDDHVHDHYVLFLEYRLDLFLEFVRLLSSCEVRQQLSLPQPTHC
jgi:hypothetical protein